jgi:hypothetical protein
MTHGASWFETAAGDVSAFPAGERGRRMRARWRLVTAAAGVVLPAMPAGTARAAAPEPLFQDAQVSVVQNDDGRLEVFAVDQSFRLWHRWGASAADPAPASDWTRLGYERVHPPVSAVVRTDGVIDVFAWGLDDHLKRIARDGVPGWTDWRDLGGTLTGRPSAAVNPDGRVQVFVRGTKGQVFHRLQLSPTANDYADFAPVTNATFDGDPVAIRRDTGLDVFGRGTDNRLHHAQKLGDAFGWEPVTSPYGDSDLLTRDPAVAPNKDALPGAFVRDQYGWIEYAAPYRSGNGSVHWFWIRTGQDVMGQPSATFGGYYGQPRVYAVGDGAPKTLRIESDGTSFGGWVSLGGIKATSVTGFAGAGLQWAFAVTSDGRIAMTHNRGESTRDERWVGWILL